MKGNDIDNTRYCSGYEWACFTLMEEYIRARNKRISLDSAPREFRPKWESKDNGKVCKT